MTDTAQKQTISQPQQSPTNSVHDEVFFKEIEKRAYKGARKAIFHATLMSILSLLILWAIAGYAVYVFAIPYVTNLSENASNPLKGLNQIEELKQNYSR